MYEGQRYQGNGDFDNAIADYIEAIRLDPKYAFAHDQHGNEFRSAGLKAPDVAP